MKLWQKISLVCSLVLLTVVLLCTRTLTNWAREEMISQSSQNNYARLTELKSSFEQFLAGHSAIDDSEAVQKALIEYCFSQVALEGSAISVEGKLIYSRTDVPLTEIVPLRLAEDVHSSDGGGADEEIIVSASAFRISKYDGLECCIYLVMDIGPLLARIDRMQLQFALRGLGFTALGLILIVWLVKRNMRHLSRLEKAAASITGGDYTVRASVNTKDELARLGDSFNVMARAVEKHVEVLEERAERQRLFICAVSHEFKTPLTAILLNTESLQTLSLTENEKEKALDRISVQGRRLESLTQKMLRLITLNEDIELTSVSVPVLLEKVADSLAARLREREISLEIRCSMDCIDADAELMLSALINLVDNAAKASSPGQTVELYAIDGVFTVKDHGHGISAQALSRVTEPFFMEDKARSRKNGGAGLGLALVDEIVRAHGGKLQIESVPEEGTEVRIILPGNKTV